MLQILALGPCLFMIFYLALIRRRDWRFAAMPSLYFLALSCGFLEPLVRTLNVPAASYLEISLTFSAHLMPEVSFLLIMQFIFGRPPPPWYWLILLLPLLGGLPLIYFSLWENTFCIDNDTCFASVKLVSLYRVFGSALVLLLLLLLLKRMPAIRRNDKIRRQRYWIILVLILSNLFGPLTDLLFVADIIQPGTSYFIKTLINAASVYLVLSSLFYVFDWRTQTADMHRLSKRDHEIAERILLIMETGRPYTSMSFNRAFLAKQLGLTEQHVSRIINLSFHKSFTSMTNEYRVRYAKDLLRKSRHSITAIALDAGFSSVTAFDRVFKQATGFSPRDFRADARLSGETNAL